MKTWSIEEMERRMRQEAFFLAPGLIVHRLWEHGDCVGVEPEAGIGVLVGEAGG